jgi:tricorn protease
VKVKTGHYLIAIDGKPVTSGDNYWKLLNNPMNRRVTFTFNSKPVEEGAWKTRIEPVPMTEYSNLRYERWVNERKEMAKKLSNGRVGYLHIKAMDQPSLRKFEKELRENRDKEALVIDQHFQRRRQHRAGTARDPGAASIPGLAAARHGSDLAAAVRVLRAESSVAELALGL